MFFESVAMTNILLTLIAALLTAVALAIFRMLVKM